MKHRLLVVILASLSMLGALSIDAYLPALPTIARDFAVTLPAVQQTLTVYLFAFAFMSLFYGTLSDSFGRRPVILGALACYLVSSFGAAFAPTLGWLLFFRTLQGMSAGAGGIVGRAIVGDMFTGAEATRIMSYISLVFGVAPAFAPILGGWLLAAFGWHSIFYFIAIFTALLFALCIFSLPETLVQQKRHAFHPTVIVRNYIAVGSHVRFLVLSMGGACAWTGIMVYVAAAPVYILDLLHLTVKDFGWLFVTFVAGMTAGSMLSGYCSHRMKPGVIIALSYGIMALASAYSLIYTSCFTPRVPWAVIPHFIYGVGVSLSAPAMTVLTLEMFPDIKGLPSSLQTFIFLITFSFISGALAPLLYASAFHLAMGAAIGLALSALCWYLGSAGWTQHPILTDEEQKLTEDAPHL